MASGWKSYWLWAGAEFVLLMVMMALPMPYAIFAGLIALLLFLFCLMFVFWPGSGRSAP